MDLHALLVLFCSSSHTQLSVVTPTGETVDRIPAWIHRAIQPKGFFSHYQRVVPRDFDSRLCNHRHSEQVGSLVYDGIYCPPSQYQWQHSAPQRPVAPRIYEVDMP